MKKMTGPIIHIPCCATPTEFKADEARYVGLADGDEVEPYNYKRTKRVDPCLWKDENRDKDRATASTTRGRV